MTNAGAWPRRSVTIQPLFGREQAREELRAALSRALAGHGALVLIAGEAGIGKTSLAEALADEAGARGALVLTGDCHDLTETPPYGPWLELLAAAAADPRLPTPPRLSGAHPATSQDEIIGRVRAFLTALAGHLPVLLLLEDVHWADPASLDLLRGVARSLSSLPVLLLATYRPEDLGRGHPLYALLPVLVREARPHRLDLLPLDERSLRELVADRYHLPEREVARLAAWLHGRGEGNPFYTGELLRGLEEQGVLRRVFGNWMLGDPAEAELPPLLRQVIDRRVARLSEEAQRALAIAAVIGTETPIALWAGVAGCDEEALLPVVSVAESHRLLTVTSDGGAVRFTHALIREALYAAAPAMQRRLWHRRAADVLICHAGPDPDVVAYHFQRAGDARAVAWLLKAAERAERAFAWRSAADRCATALGVMERQGVDAAERGWLGYRLAALRRYRDPRGALAVLSVAGRHAAESGDRVLAACTLFLQGNLHCYQGEFGAGLVALDQGLAALDALTDGERARVPMLGAAGGFTPDSRQLRGTLAMRLAGTGRFADALRIGGQLTAVASPPADGGDLAEANALRGLAVAHAALGRPQEARMAFARARAVYHRLGDHFHVGITATQELQWVAQPYRADHPRERQHLAEEAEQAWSRAGDTPADLPDDFARLATFLLSGHWDAARAVAMDVYAGGGSHKATAVRALALLAREQGDLALARQMIEDELPAGPDTPVGTANFSNVLLLQRLAAAAALADGASAEAREWLEAHDRWLNWSAALLGRAERELEWASYYRAAADTGEARRRAACALRDAEDLHQPLPLLAAHRLLGELDTGARRYGEAAHHLEQALRLADTCAVPYERALTLLSLAELHIATGDRSAAAARLDEARTTCTLLRAAPALARAAALTRQLAATRAGGVSFPAGLSEREVEVLRLVAAGESNRAIAAMLTLSVRTVEKHIAHIYTKLGARGRAEAAAFAVRQGLLTDSSGRS